MAEPAGCRICGSATVVPFTAREMMFGLRAEFAYIECSSCGCVQIAAYPGDVARYYPDDYYSFSPPDPPPSGAAQWLTDRLRRVVMSNTTLRRQWLRKPANQAWLARKPELSFYVNRFPSLATRFLDVGCGSGILSRSLISLGFVNAQGVDPYIPEEIQHNGRMLVWKRDLSEVAGRYDCISFHHSLEHLSDQVAVLTSASILLEEGGVILVCIPIAGTQAWRQYRENWVQLDAPRHFYCHTVESLSILARQCGLEVEAVTYISTGFQFWGSELYARGIPLYDARSPAQGSGEIFSAEMMEGFSRQADALNAKSDGDTIMAVLAKSTEGQ